MKAQLWSEWIAEHQHPLYRYLYRVCGLREIAEELLQETCHRAMLSLSIQAARQAQAWGCKAARHLYMDWLRKKHPKKAGGKTCAACSARPCAYMNRKRSSAKKRTRSGQADHFKKRY